MNIAKKIKFMLGLLKFETEIKGKDGIIYVTENLEIGGELYVKTDPETIVLCPDGSYEMEDDTIVTVIDGKISEIKPKEEESPAEEAPGEEVESKKEPSKPEMNFEEEITSLKDEIKKLKDAISLIVEENNKVEELEKQVAEFAKQPAAKSITKITETSEVKTGNKKVDVLVNMARAKKIN